jgi:hypothetical protein
VLGYKIPVPPKSKPKAWEKLRLAFYQSRNETVRERTMERVRRAHDLEQEIARLERMGSNPGRTTAVKLLKKQLAKMRP